MGTCQSTTVYLSGVQVRLADISSARLDGRTVDVTRLHLPSESGQLEIVTPYGVTTVTLDRGRLHGRAARGGGAGSVDGDAVLAALALRNLAGHPRRSESRAAGRRQCASALACVEPAALETIAREFPEALAAWSALAPAQLAARLLRQPALFELARARAQLGAFPALSARLAEPPELVAPDTGTAQWRFTVELAAGGRPEPAKGSYSQRAALAATHPDIAQEMLADTHPLVRVAAYRHATDEQLAEALRSEVSTAARRAAAVTVTERLGVPLVAEGPIGGRQAGVTPGRPDILFVDVDGTLIEGPAVRDDASLAALRAAQTAGVQVVLVTGRTLEELVPLELGFDLVVADGDFVDLATGRLLASGDGRRKDAAVATVCELLGTGRCAAVGDGAIDATMFEAVRARGGRAGSLVSGQDEAIAAATDLVGPLHSGGVGRFVERLLSGEPGTLVAPLAPAAGRTTNYASWQVGRDSFAAAVAQAGIPDGWKDAHGHVTFAYPTADSTGPLPSPDPQARLEAYATVVTENAAALAVRAVLPDGQVLMQQAQGTPLHLTLATAPSSRGGYVPPAAAGRAVAAAIENGTLQPLDTPIPLPALAAPAGAPERRLPAAVEAAALAGGGEGRDALWWHRMTRTAGETFADHASAPDPLTAALRDAAPLTAGLVVLSGVPGSGKTTYARELERHGAVSVSLDGIRGELNGDESSQARLPDVLAVAQARLAAELSLGRVVVSDATNVETRVIAGLAETAKLAGAGAIGVPFEVEPAVALERDRQRHQDGQRAVGRTTDGTWDENQSRSIIDRMEDRWRRTGGSDGARAAGLDTILGPGEVLAALRRR